MAKRARKNYGAWALVAGAAEGLGEAFTIALASRGMNIVMVDISSDSMDKTSTYVESNYKIETKRIVMDLSDDIAWSHCMEAIRGLDCRLLIYNAAISNVAPFLSHSHEILTRQVMVNASTVIHLVRAFAEHLKLNGTGGGILLMASLSALSGTPLVASYAATKSFNITLAESLHTELRPYNIDLSACIAGITTTPKFWESNPTIGKFHPHMMSPLAVAEYALKNLGKKVVIIPGWPNRFSAFVLRRILPGKWARYFVARNMYALYKS